MFVKPLIRTASLAMALALFCSLTACGQSSAATGSQSTTASTTTTTSSSDVTDSTDSTDSTGSTASILDTSDIFTSRDLSQTADFSEGVSIEVTDGEDIQITEAGVYILTGTASDVTIYVEVGDEDKVQLVLDGLNLTNTDTPCIYVVNADKVFVTTASDSSLSVTETFADDENDASAVIFSKDDLVLNGTAVLTISSSDTGIDSNDDLKVTGGTYVITAATKALEANDTIAIADGTFTITAGTDGLHAENDDEGIIYIAGGTFNIQAEDDGIHAAEVVQIDDGTITLSASEGIESTYVQINGGTLDITSDGDGINAGQKSDSYAATIEITGGDITIVMEEGDTDALDANGDLIISGGTVTITADSAFDFDGTGTLTGGTVVVNGTEVSELTSSMP